MISVWYTTTEGLNIDVETGEEWRSLDIGRWMNYTVHLSISVEFELYKFC